MKISPTADVRLDGKVVIITGSGRGIGAACARLVAELGALVVVNDITAQDAERVTAQIRSQGGEATAHPADVAVRDEVAALVQRCIDIYGRIDGLVNNAALMSLGRIEDHDDERLRRLLDVNVVGGFNCVAEALPHMYGQRSGSIVNVTSGAHLGMWHASDYAATKGAVASMIYSWALEVEGSGVRVNGLSPLALGAMATQTEAYLQRTVDPHTVITAPTPAESAPVVAYLLSDRSAHLNGQIVRSEGSRLSLMAHPAVLGPVLTRECWSVDDVDRAFATVFDDRRSPSGIAWTTNPATTDEPASVEFS